MSPFAPASLSPASLSPESPPLIELDHASVVRSQVKVLHDVTLCIQQGQHTAILGPNGCGKSTFIKLITRELHPLARREENPPIRLLGQTRWKIDQLRSQLGVITSDFSDTLTSMAKLTVEDAVLSGFFASFALASRREVNEEMRQRACMALQQVEALHLRERYYDELSAGQARRVLIARALVNDPRALLLDEPTTGLDLIARQRLIDTMRRLARQGITLVLVTHHIEEIVPEIRRVVLMRNGRITGDGPCESLLTSERLSDTFDGSIRVWKENECYLATAAGGS
ncbi:MAG: ATP-binding cassette domain-containing protein [Xanthomonadaceae bacterium]|jgi:iron complex transport system ATP-binding protein|nr:ATP-binding cassette domain-containing protein [Xanthomonadaceae bacterium]